MFSFVKRLLVSWLGRTDLRAPRESEEVGLGPIAQAAEAANYDEILLLADYPRDVVAAYLKWLRARAECRIEAEYPKLTGPTEFGEIYEAAVDILQRLVRQHGEGLRLTFHLSPGTPAMAAVWIILAKTRFPAELIESSREFGVRTASVPFDISADFIPDLLRSPDRRLEELSAGLPPAAPEFDDIVHRSKAMERVIVLARRVAPRSVPVLIEGETGTGKELLARAIHRGSPRREGPFQAVNCGAISPELVESELFGHEKGAFTGATQRRQGQFEAATGGTLFLDEVGDLPKSAQVKLLRVLQEGSFSRVGSTQSLPADVRIVTATNRILIDEVAQGRFREDLFHRLAVAILRLPPLRERRGDLPLLIDHLLALVNQESAEEPGFKHKKLSAGTKNLLRGHSWPGNVRELLNTLRRAAIWSAGETISAEDLREALLPTASPAGSDILNRPLGDDLSLPGLLETVAKHYLARALDETHDNKTRAAELVGLRSYQTFSNWMKRYGVGG